jgi:hypothetical protein
MRPDTCFTVQEPADSAKEGPWNAGTKDGLCYSVQNNNYLGNDLSMWMFDRNDAFPWYIPLISPPLVLNGTRSSRCGAIDAGFSDIAGSTR